VVYAMMHQGSSCISTLVHGRSDGPEQIQAA